MISKNLIKRILLNSFKRTKKVDLHRFDRTVHWTIRNDRIIDTLAKSHGQILSDKIREYKKSDTLFILGSGPSINLIKEKEWQEIKKHDSIGFNFWMAHDFVPDLYLFQTGKDDIKKMIFNLLDKKREQYSTVPLIIRGNGLVSGELDFDEQEGKLLKEFNVFYLKEYFIHPNCQIDPIDILDYSKSIGVLRFDKITPFILKNKVTLGLLLPLAYEMGYKKIVLCGMDMKDSSHFWDYPPNDKLKEKYDLVPPGKADIKQWTDKEKYSTTIPDNVVAFRDWANKEEGVELYVANKNTLLYPEIKLYFE